MTGHGHSVGEQNSRFIGTVRPWSTSILLTMVRSNSSRMTDWAMCAASSGWPFTTGTGRGPQPSSAGGNSAAQPSAKVGTNSTENAEAWSLYTTMATSGLASAIHSLDFSKPENTRFQYGSSVCLLSIAAPMAGTCDDATPAMILATVRPLSALRLGFGFCGFRFAGLRGLRLGLHGLRRPLGLALLAEHASDCAPAGPAAVAFDRAAALEHHVGVVLLGRTRHGRGQMTERVPVRRAELGGEIDVAAELQHAVVVALEDGLGLLRRQLELLEIFRLVRLEGLAVLVLHQRHAEHVDAVALARALGVEHEGPRDVVVVVPRACHRVISVPAAVRPRNIVANRRVGKGAKRRARRPRRAWARRVLRALAHPTTPTAPRDDICSTPIKPHRIVDEQRTLQRRGRRDLGNHVEQDAVVRRFRRHVGMRPVGAPQHAVREALDDRAGERHHVVIGRAHEREPFRARHL